MKTVILVPRREDGGHRDRLWAHCKALWIERHPEWEIYEGHHNDGPFNRSSAVNLAAEMAGDWDVALIIDSDVITAPDSVEDAVKLAYSTDKMVVAHDERVMLSKSGTESVLGGYMGPWRARSMVERVWMDSVSCAVAVSRKLWEMAGPFDEKFVGWGREDTAFRISCEAETGPILKVCGETFHLWHPVSREADRSSPIRKANEARHQAYVDARGKRERVRALRLEMMELPERTIPRIIHRTVPAETSDEVEAYWEKFQKLHPGWELRTYREPINPREWPMTGHLFNKCQNGAQKAGLIRLEALYTYGGIYVDSDCEPFKSLEDLLDVQAFAAWEDAHVIPDAVLGAKKEHPAFKLLIENACASVERGEDAWKSGPGVTTALLPTRTDVLILAPGAFYPMHYLDRQSRQMVVAEKPPWAWMVHHYAHSWGTEAERARIAAKQRVSA